MRLYFSGINSKKTYDLLKRAGVRFLLADQFDLRHIPENRANVILDSGAYRAWKKNWTLDVAFYAEIAKSRSNFDHIITLDVFGKPQESKRNWITLQNDFGLNTMPVWFFDDEPDEKLLHQYTLLSQYVGIGGLVPSMRARDEDILEGLKILCRRYPNRLHLFGLNWLKAICELKDTAYSADTSKWLDGARYRHSIEFDRQSGELVQIRSFKERDELCIENARNMEAYTLGLPEPLPVEQCPDWTDLKTRSYKINHNRKYK